MTKLTGLFLAVAGLIFLSTEEVHAQAYRDCAEAGGTYGECQEPDVSPWEAYGVWGAAALPSGSCPQAFETENEAIQCAQEAIASANIGTGFGKWCRIDWNYDDERPWSVYSQYHGWITSEKRAAMHFRWMGYDVYGKCVLAEQIGNIAIVRSRKVRCPPGYGHWVLRSETQAICYRLARAVDSDRCTNPLIGNPVKVTDRAKIQVEVDYASASSGLLRIERRYSSAGRTDLGKAPTGLGSKWRSNFERSITVNSFSPMPIVFHRDSDGDVIAFSKQSSGWVSAASRSASLREIVDGNGIRIGWVFVGPSNESEYFDAAGRLVRITDARGLAVTLAYGPTGRLAKAVDSFGRALVFTSYADSHSGIAYRTDIIDPAGGRISHLWDQSTGSEPGPAKVKAFDLTSVIYPDGTSRRFHYSEPDKIVVPPGASAYWTYNLLTGVTDESNKRSLTYTYNYDSRVLSSERAGGASKYSFAQVPSLDAVLVTDPLGTVRQYTLLRGRVQQVTQPPGSGSAACASSIAYDIPTGLPTEFEDFAGNLACVRYDASRQLIVARLEGTKGKAWSGHCNAYWSTPPAGARLISTEWHPDWRLETKIAQPKKLTTIVYNGQGATCAPDTVLVDGKPPAVVCSRTEQATTDETGAAGFAATVTGVARTWSYTYTTYGRVLTATDPNGAVTSYTYHPDNDANLGRRGNVASITNAVGHVTRITAYNAHGQPTRIIDPNNLVTDLTYDLRMRLTRRKVGNESTSFVYDAAGQLTRVTLPDGARLTYTYDAAHRLTAIADHKGNKVAYTLDAMGNRINEKLTDPGGVLVRNIQRSIDALNRVQQVTGAVH